MASQALIKNSLVIYVILFFALISFSAEEKATKEITAITQILNERTNGNDSYFSKVLSPAQSLEVNKSKSDRIISANQSIIDELTSVFTAFKSSAEDKKVDAVSEAVNQIEPDLVKNAGAFVTFYDSVPSAAVSRTMLMLSKKLKPGLSTDQVFNILTSYKRSAKPSDQLYEYSFASDITQGSVLHSQGSDTTWMGAAAATPLALGENIVLKKCRQLLGWRCVTSLYRADSLLKAEENVKVLFISIYDLENNPDHPDFAKDKRSNNQITGSTAVYFVKESADWILIYGIDTQWNTGKLTFQSAIQNEFKKDFDRFKERISSDLQLSTKL